MARPRIPVVITHHCDIIRQPLLKCAITPFENFVYGKATRILATNRAYLSDSPVLQRHEDRVESLEPAMDRTAAMAESDPMTMARRSIETYRQAIFAEAIPLIHPSAEVDRPMIERPAPALRMTPMFVTDEDLRPAARSLRLVPPSVDSTARPALRLTSH
jgi:hypothetical protein